MMLNMIFDRIEFSVAFLAKGGLLMIPILLSSLIAVTVIIERFWYYHHARCDTNRLYSQLYPLAEYKRISEAIALCQTFQGVLPRVLTIVLQNSQLPIEDIEKQVSAAGTREIQQLSKHVRGLGIIGNVAPLLGLLGTVFGMVKTFMQIAELQGQVNPSVLAGGIWEALLTTAAGLTVAIPVVIMHHYFEGVVEQFAFQMKHDSLELIEFLKNDNDPAHKTHEIHK